MGTYTQLEYIESTGKQYIDTLIKPNQDTRVYIEYSITFPSESSYVFGANNGENYVEMVSLPGGEKVQIFYGASNYSLPFNISKKVIADYNKNSVSVNGLPYIFSKKNFSIDSNLFLFSTNSGTANGARMRLYFCSIYSRNTLRAMFVPYKDSNNVVGLYDIVTNKVFVNKGTDSFIAGPTATSNIFDTRNYLAGIADAIRSKDNSTDNIPAKNFPQRIIDLDYGLDITETIDPSTLNSQQDYLMAISNAIKAKEGTTEAIPATNFANRVVAIPHYPEVLSTTSKTGNLSVSRNVTDSTNVGNYVLFGPGAYWEGTENGYSSTPKKVIDVLDGNMTRTDTFDVSFSAAVAACNSNYGIFAAQGTATMSDKTTIVCYDKDLTAKNPTVCFGTYHVSRYTIDLDNFAMFLGSGSTKTNGIAYNPIVDGYDENLTYKKLTNLPYAMYNFGCCVFNGYALVIGGTYKVDSTTTYSDGIYGYDKNFTFSKITTFDLTYKATRSAVATPNHLVFNAGANKYSLVAYDKEWTATTIASLAYTVYSYYSPNTAGNYIAFCPGRDNSGGNKYLSVFDDELVLDSTSYVRKTGGTGLAGMIESASTKKAFYLPGGRRRYHISNSQGYGWHSYNAVHKFYLEKVKPT